MTTWQILLLIIVGLLALPFFAYVLGRQAANGFIDQLSEFMDKIQHKFKKENNNGKKKT